jgi:sec-independent protein translocase protein TatB
MDFLGIGPGELVFILVLALIVLGPRDMEKVGRQIGSFVRRFILSPEWRAVRKTSEQIKDLPAKFIREANDDLQDVRQEVGKVGRELDQTVQAVGDDLPKISRPQDENRIAPKPRPVPAKTAASQPVVRSAPVVIPQGRFAKTTDASPKPEGD